MLLLAFAAVLLLAVLLSGLAHRTVLSTAVVFLAAGFIVGDGATGLVPLAADDPIVATLSELALFAVLFSDGMRAGWPNLKQAWKLPGRALAVGMPITMVVTALLAHFVVGLNWAESFLIGAILAPTDPVFAAALVGNKRVPGKLRSLLNVESGVNDGLALPFVIVLLALANNSGDLHLVDVGLELVVGVAIGVLVPLVAIKLEQTRFFSASTHYEPLNAVAIGVLVFALGKVTHGNLFLAAFAAGVTVATIGEKQRQTFEEFGELTAELLKLAALLVFGALITPSMLTSVGASGWIFAVLALFLARPLALLVAFWGADLNLREHVAASWFGPKGFASVVYGLIVLNSGIGNATELFNIVAVTVVLSIVLHSSTDVVVARWFDDATETPRWQGPGAVLTRLRRRRSVVVDDDTPAGTASTVAVDSDVPDDAADVNPLATLPEPPGEGHKGPADSAGAGATASGRSSGSAGAAGAGSAGAGSGGVAASDAQTSADADAASGDAGGRPTQPRGSNTNKPPSF